MEVVYRMAFMEVTDWFCFETGLFAVNMLQ